MFIIDMLKNIFRDGGVVMWPIILVSAVSWYIGLERLSFIKKIKKSRQSFLDNIEDKSNNAVFLKEEYLVLKKNLDLVRNREKSFRYIFHQFLSAVVPDMNRGFNAMSAWISAAPLLGLLGTVTGMIKTFSLITEFGIGNPHFVAEGISMALLTTQAGLTVAFPAMLFHNFLLNRKNRLISLMIKDGEELTQQLYMEEQEKN